MPDKWIIETADDDGVTTGQVVDCYHTITLDESAVTIRCMRVSEDSLADHEWEEFDRARAEAIA